MSATRTAASLKLSFTKLKIKTISRKHNLSFIIDLALQFIFKNLCPIKNQLVMNLHKFSQLSIGRYKIYHSLITCETVGWLVLVISVLDVLVLSVFLSTSMQTPGLYHTYVITPLLRVLSNSIFNNHLPFNVTQFQALKSP
jgi:hypothetical protein